VTHVTETEKSSYVEFAGMQVEIRTSIEAVQDMVAAVFEHMLVPASIRSAGTIQAQRSESGYLLKSITDIPFQRDQLDLLLEMVRDEVHFQFMRARPDLLWLHAATVERNGAALLIAGQSGQGKSTLSTKLCERGWRLLSDDISPVSMEEDVVYPFPQMPRRRRFPGAMVDRYKLHTLEREVVVMRAEGLSRLPVTVSAIAYIEFMTDGDATLETLSRGAAALELLRNSVNFGDHRNAAVSRAASLCVGVRAYRLCYNSVTTAVDYLETLL
jgi:hypothetical protein